MNTKLSVLILFCSSFGLISPNCDHEENEIQPSNFLIATCSYPDGKSLTYYSSNLHFDLVLVESGMDTLYLDSEDEKGHWIMIALVYDDLSKLSEGTYTINSSQKPGQAWVVHLNNEIDTEVFWPDDGKGGGKLIIERYVFEGRKIKGKFMSAVNTGFNTGTIDGNFEVY